MNIFTEIIIRRQLIEHVTGILIFSSYVFRVKCSRSCKLKLLQRFMSETRFTVVEEHMWSYEESYLLQGIIELVSKIK